MAPRALPFPRLELDRDRREESAFLRMRPKYLAIPPSGLCRINLDLTMMVSMVVAAWPRLLELRSEIVRQMPDFDLVHIDELQDAAYGLAYTQGRVASLDRPTDDLAALNQEASNRRDRAIKDLTNLAAHGIIDASRLDDLSRRKGFKNVVDDMRLCLSVYRSIWGTLQGNTCSKQADLLRAEAVIHRMELLIGERELGRNSLCEWSNMRERAFTLLWGHYSQARRAAVYLRWDAGDADSIAPSLFKGRIKRGKRKATQQDQPAADVGQPELDRANELH